MVRTRTLTVLMSTRPAALVLKDLGGVDALGEESIELCIGERLRQVGLEDLELSLFLGDEIGAIALAKLSQRILALLDHALENGLHAGIIQRPTRIDLALLDPGKRHAQHAEACLVAAFHGGLHVFS